MTTAIQPLFAELTEEEGTDIQGGQAFFFNVPLYSYGSLGAFVDATPGVAPTSGLILNLPVLKDLLSLIGINTTTFVLTR
jgi:hypothetical protein